MTTSLKGFTVIFEQDFRADDAEAIREAILLLRGVGDVIPVEKTLEDSFAISRVRRELGEKILNILREGGGD